MDLVEVNGVGLEPAQAVLALAANGRFAQRVVDLALLMPDHAALGEDVGTRPLPVRQRLGDDLLRVAQAVDGGGVDPVDAQFQRLADR